MYQCGYRHILELIGVFNAPLPKQRHCLPERGLKGFVPQEILAQTGVDFAYQRVVLIEQPQAEPAAVEPSRAFFLHERLQQGDRIFDGVGIPDRKRFARLRSGAHPLQTIREKAQAFFPARRRPDHRHPQTPGEQLKVELYAFALRFVHQIDAYHDAPRYLKRLQNKIQVPLKAGRVAHNDDRVRLPEADEIPRDLLLGRVRHQRISAGDIDHDVGAPAGGASPLSVRNGLSRPVARVLVQAGQGVEHGAFSHVRVSGQRDYLVVRGQLLYRRPCVDSPDPDRAFCQAHLRTPCHDARIRISAQSSERMAITAPRIRKAEGSPPGLLPRHSTSVFSTRPISKSLRRMLPVDCSRLTTACWPGAMSFRQKCSFITMTPFE